MEAGDLPGAVDVARYFILHAQGGIYLDCDWYPARDDLSFADVLPLIGFRHCWKRRRAIPALVARF